MRRAIRAGVSVNLLLSGLMLAGLGGCAAVGTVEDRAATRAAGSWLDARANEFMSSTQAGTVADIFDNGDVLVAWDSRRQQGGQYGVYARVLNAAGEPLTPEVEVNEFLASAQQDPVVACAPDGSAWIAWSSVGQDRMGVSVVARRFDPHLVPLSDEIMVSNPEGGSQSDPALAINDAGRILVVWNATSTSNGELRIEGRMLDPDGLHVTEVFAIDHLPGAVDSLPCVVASGDSFIVSWSTRTDGVAGSSVLAIRIDNEARRGRIVDVSAGFAGDNIEPSIAADARGGFAVAWHHADPGVNNHTVMFGRWDENEQPEFVASEVSSEAAGWVSGAAVAMENGGRALVAWNQWNADGDGLAVLAQWIDRHGQPQGSPFVVSEASAGHQAMTMAGNATRLTFSPAGQIAVAWSGDSGQGDDSAANVSIYRPQNLAVTPAPALVTVASAARSKEVIAPIPPIYDPNWEPLPPPADAGDGETNFMGINFTGWSPPDPEIAVGPDHLVAMTNGAIAFFDMNGNLLFEDEIEDSFGFWGAQGATDFVFDPECLYDPHSGRFFAMACERGNDGLSYYLLAVSDDSNPVGTWHKYRIHSPVDNDIDSPNMAVDEDVVYLTADFFGPDKYGIVFIEKAPILSGGAINQRTMTITGSGDQSIGIPVTYDTNVPAQYMIQSSEGTANGLTFSEVRFHALRNQLTTPTRVTIDVAVPTYSYPNQPPQMGTTNRPFLFEPRFWSCMYVGGSLWAVHHVNNSRARARWYEFRMNGWPESGQNPTLQQSGELDYGDPVHTFFPSIAADAAGNAAFVFARSSPSEFISMCGTYRLASDALGTTRPMTFLKQSTAPYTAFNRWGDYSHIEPDPDTDFTQFWGMHEWTDVSSSWRTWIARIDAVPDIATLTDFSVQFGTHLSGGLAQLLESDNDRVRVRSAFGFSAQAANLIDQRIGAETSNLGASEIDLTVEGRLNQSGGNARLRLRNWTTNSFQEVHEYALGSTEIVESVTGVDATDRIRQTDGRILLSMRFTVLATLSAQGFDAFTDQVVIAPR